MADRIAREERQAVLTAEYERKQIASGVDPSCSVVIFND
jgi:hypothetical protein